EGIEQRPSELCDKARATCWRSNFTANYVTRGTRTSGIESFLVDQGSDALLVYAHSHEPFLLGKIEVPRRRRQIPALRLPSLIDNSSAVLFSGGKLASVRLPSRKRVHLLDGSERYLTWLYAKGDLCQARSKEVWDLARNLRAFTRGRCPAQRLSEIE